jgi:hypothetical protein
MVTRRLVLQASALPLAARPQTTLRFVFSRPFANPRTQWLILVYKDVCAMAGVGFDYLDVPPKRATAMVQASRADGELGRTYGYLAFHPKLVRLREPNNVVNFCVYGAGPRARFDGLETLRQSALRCECRRGIVELEALLGQHTGAGQLSLIDDIGQGLRKLHLGRTDLYFDVQEAVDDYLTFRHCHPGLPDTLVIRELAKVQSTTGHCYLNPSRAALAPVMSEALATLKRDGTVARHLQHCLQDYQQRCLRDTSGL